MGTGGANSGQGSGNSQIEPLRVDFKNSTGQGISAQDQANVMIAEINRAKDNHEKVAFTYSANLDQAKEITQGYSSGQYGISGSNQAAVFGIVAKYIQDNNLQDTAHILPIPTCRHSGNTGAPLQTSEVQPYMDNVAQHLGAGWHVKGIQNQDTPQGKFAIGGGVVQGWSETPVGKAVTSQLSQMASGNLSSGLQAAYNRGAQNGVALTQGTPGPQQQQATTTSPQYDETGVTQSNTVKPLQVDMMKGDKQGFRNADQQAQDIIDQIKQKKPGEKMAFTYGTSLEQAQAIVDGYKNGEVPAEGKFYGAVMGKVADYIKENGLQDEVHIVPVPTFKKDSDGKYSNTTPQETQPFFNNVAAHLGDGWNVQGVTNEFAHKNGAYAIGGHPTIEKWKESDIGQAVKTQMNQLTSGKLNPTLQQAFEAGATNGVPQVAPAQLVKLAGEEIESVKAEQQSITEGITATEAKIEDLKAEETELNEKVSAKQAEVDDLGEQMAAKQQAIDDFQPNQNEPEDAAAQRKADLEGELAQLRTKHETESQGLKDLKEDAGAVHKQVEQQGKIKEKQIELSNTNQGLEEKHTEKKELLEKNKQFSADIDRLEKLDKMTPAQQKELKQLKADQNENKEKIADVKQEIKGLKDKKQEIKGDIQKLEKEMPKKPSVEKAEKAKIKPNKVQPLKVNMAKGGMKGFRSADEQAQDIINQIKNKEPGEKMAFVYGTSQQQAKGIVDGYKSGDVPAEGKFYDAVMGKVADYIKENNLQDEVHLLPVATYKQEQDGKFAKTTPEETQPYMNNVAQHLGDGWNVQGVQNEFTAKHDAYAIGGHPNIEEWRKSDLGQIVKSQMNQLASGDLSPELAEAYEQGAKHGVQSTKGMTREIDPLEQVATDQNNLKASQARLEDQTVDCEKKLGDLNNTQKDLEKKIEAKEAEVKELPDHIEAKGAEVQAAKAKVQGLDAEVNELKQKVDEMAPNAIKADEAIRDFESKEQAVAQAQEAFDAKAAEFGGVPNESQQAELDGLQEDIRAKEAARDEAKSTLDDMGGLDKAKEDRAEFNKVLNNYNKKGAEKFNTEQRQTQLEGEHQALQTKYEASTKELGDLKADAEVGEKQIKAQDEIKTKLDSLKGVNTDLEGKLAEKKELLEKDKQIKTDIDRLETLDKMSPDQQKELTQLKADQSENKEKLASVDDDIKGLKAKKEALQGEVKKLETDMPKKPSEEKAEKAEAKKENKEENKEEDKKKAELSEVQKKAQLDQAKRQAMINGGDAHKQQHKESRMKEMNPFNKQNLGDSIGRVSIGRGEAEDAGRVIAEALIMLMQILFGMAGTKLLNKWDDKHGASKDNIDKLDEQIKEKQGEVKKDRQELKSTLDQIKEIRGDIKKAKAAKDDEKVKELTGKHDQLVENAKGQWEKVKKGEKGIHELEKKKVKMENSLCKWKVHEAYQQYDQMREGKDKQAKLAEVMHLQNDVRKMNNSESMKMKKAGNDLDQRLNAEEQQLNQMLGNTTGPSMALTAGTPGATVTDQDITKAQEKAAEAKEKFDQAEQKLDECEKKLQQAKDELDKLTQQKAQEGDDFKDQDKMDDAKRNLESAQGQRDDALRDLESAKEEKDIANQNLAKLKDQQQQQQGTGGPGQGGPQGPTPSGQGGGQQPAAAAAAGGQPPSSGPQDVTSGPATVDASGNVQGGAQQLGSAQSSTGNAMGGQTLGANQGENLSGATQNLAGQSGVEGSQNLYQLEGEPSVVAETGVADPNDKAVKEAQQKALDEANASTAAAEQQAQETAASEDAQLKAAADEEQARLEAESLAAAEDKEAQDLEQSAAKIEGEDQESGIKADDMKSSGAESDTLEQPTDDTGTLTVDEQSEGLSNDTISANTDTPDSPDLGSGGSSKKSQKSLTGGAPGGSGGTDDVSSPDLGSTGSSSTTMSMSAAGGTGSTGTSMNMGNTGGGMDMSSTGGGMDMSSTGGGMDLGGGADAKSSALDQAEDLGQQADQQVQSQIQQTQETEADEADVKAEENDADTEVALADGQTPDETVEGEDKSIADAFKPDKPDGSDDPDTPDVLSETTDSLQQVDQMTGGQAADLDDTVNDLSSGSPEDIEDLSGKVMDKGTDMANDGMDIAGSAISGPGGGGDSGGIVSAATGAAGSTLDTAGQAVDAMDDMDDTMSAAASGDLDAVLDKLMDAIKKLIEMIPGGQSVEQGAEATESLSSGDLAGGMDKAGDSLTSGADTVSQGMDMMPGGGSGGVGGAVEGGTQALGGTADTTMDAINETPGMDDAADDTLTVMGAGQGSEDDDPMDDDPEQSEEQSLEEVMKILEEILKMLIQALEMAVTAPIKGADMTMGGLEGGSQALEGQQPTAITNAFDNSKKPDEPAPAAGQDQDLTQEATKSAGMGMKPG